MPFPIRYPGNHAKKEVEVFRKALIEYGWQMVVTEPFTKPWFLVCRPMIDLPWNAKWRMGRTLSRWGRFSSTRIVMNKCCKWKCFFTPLPLNNWQWNLQECYDFVLSSFRPPVILVLKIRDPQISQNSFPIKRRFHDKRKADVKPPPRRSPQPLGWLGQASASPPSCYCCWGSQGNMATEDALSSEIVGRSPGRNSSFGNSKGKPHAKKKDPIQTHANWFPKKRERVLEVALMCKKAFCRSFSASSSPARGRNICCYAPDMASSQAGAKGWLRCWTKTPVEKQLRIVFLWAMEATAGILATEERHLFLSLAAPKQRKLSSFCSIIQTFRHDHWGKPYYHTGFTVIFQLPVRHAFWEDLEEK